MSTYTVKVYDRSVKTVVVSTQEQLDQSLRELLSTISKNTDSIKRVVALDIEKDYIADSCSTRLTEKVAIVKLCYAKSVLIIQLLHMKAAPYMLSRFLQLQQLCFVGIGMKHCLEALERDYGIKCRNAADLGELAATKKENGIFKAYGLLDLADNVCFLGTNQAEKILKDCNSGALSSWSAKVFSLEQIVTATNSAFLCFYVGNDLLGGRLPSEPNRPCYDYYCDY